MSLERSGSVTGVVTSERPVAVPSNLLQVNPILNGVTDMFADSDVYEAYLPKDATILVRGLVLENHGSGFKALH